MIVHNSRCTLGKGESFVSQESKMSKCIVKISCTKKGQNIKNLPENEIQ